MGEIHEDNNIGFLRCVRRGQPRSEMVTSVESHASDVPQQFSLSQNYPNPFNPGSDIRYQISEFSIVHLAVHDLLGREVAVLVK